MKCNYTVAVDTTLKNSRLVMKMVRIIETGVLIHPLTFVLCHKLDLRACHPTIVIKVVDYSHTKILFSLKYSEAKWNNKLFLNLNLNAMMQTCQVSSHVMSYFNFSIFMV